MLSLAKRLKTKAVLEQLNPGHVGPAKVTGADPLGVSAEVLNLGRILSRIAPEPQSHLSDPELSRVVSLGFLRLVEKAKAARNFDRHVSAWPCLLVME
jgi:hypothetical protein